MNITDAHLIIFNRVCFCQVFYSVRIEVSETMSSTENQTILVDAGHGGADPGMIGVNGLEERG